MVNRRNVVLGGSMATLALAIRDGVSQEHTSQTWTALANGQRMTVNGIVYEAECGQNRVALQQSRAGVFRFSMIPGNLWLKDDPLDSERTELDGWKGHIPVSQPLWSSWSMYYEPGAWSSADWCILRQIYAFYSDRGRPWSALVLKPGGLLHWIGGAADDPPRFWPTRYNQPIQQGQWYNFVETYKFDPEGGAGYWRSWLDGTQVLDFRGAVGKPSMKSHYAKFGIYRSRQNSAGGPVPETVNARFANMRFTTLSLAHLISKPEAVPAFEQWL